MNYIQWQRQTDGSLQLKVAENVNNPSVNSWKPYTSSINYLPDLDSKLQSKGMRTFQNCVKLGYKVISVKGELVN
jgi:hypothetical protein